ncbi:hypothetical protein QQF64_013023 [Cirrhinus molitorella]|uniref:Uncharacterized protein n=1 Tax=Cirrhinus molitorella TaxID=172907 RepID=A0ABR3LQ02_9TELE
MALVLAGFVLCLSGLPLILAADYPTYVAAVYEHRVLLNPNPIVPLNRSSALEHMKQNLRVYEEQTALAAQQVTLHRQKNKQNQSKNLYRITTKPPN